MIQKIKKVFDIAINISVVLWIIISFTFLGMYLASMYFGYDFLDKDLGQIDLDLYFYSLFAITVYVGMYYLKQLSNRLFMPNHDRGIIAILGKLNIIILILSCLI